MTGLIIILIILIIVWAPVALIGTSIGAAVFYEGGLVAKLASAVGIVALYTPFIAVGYMMTKEKK